MSSLCQHIVANLFQQAAPLASTTLPVPLLHLCDYTISTYASVQEVHAVGKCALICTYRDATAAQLPTPIFICKLVIIYYNVCLMTSSADTNLSSTYITGKQHRVRYGFNLSTIEYTVAQVMSSYSRYASLYTWPANLFKRDVKRSRHIPAALGLFKSHASWGERMNAAVELPAVLHKARVATRR
eukprot:13432-Heterococcus_DN1.PRE.2